MIHTGDCLVVMRTMPSESVDAIVTDPPAGIAFMSKHWDRDKGGRTEWVAWMTEVMCECYRVLKPGGYAVVWSLPRTCHWTAWAMEDAGFIIRDQLAHVFASGFPKGKAQLKPAREDWWLARKPGPLRPLNIEETRIGYVSESDTPTQEEWNRAGSSGQPGANGYAGQFSKGMKDAYAEGKIPVPSGRWPSNLLLSDPELFDEPNPWVVGSGATDAGGGFGVRGQRTVGDGWATRNGDANVMRGTGEMVGYGDSGGYSRFFTVPQRYNETCHNCGLAIIVGSSSSPENEPSDTAPSDVQISPAGTLDSTVLDTPEPSLGTSITTDEPPTSNGSTSSPSTTPTRRSKRLATSPESGPPSSPARLKDAASSETVTTTTTPSLSMCATCAEATTSPSTSVPVERPDSPRYLIIPKADRADREPVLRGQLEPGMVGGRNRVDGRQWDIPGSTLANNKPKRENTHATVKPVPLMRHLVRLVTPPGGTVLDPFLGSGSTAIAAELEGFPWIGIEKEPEYVAIAEARLNGTQRGLGLDVGAPTPRRGGPTGMEKGHHPDSYQRHSDKGWSGGWADTPKDEPCDCPDKDFCLKPCHPFSEPAA